MTAQNQRGEEDAQVVRLAEFRVLGPGPEGEPIAVHFNPESLEYTVTNNIKDQGNSTENKQQVSKSSGKLSLELVFDTTLDGSDVREKTEQLQVMMKPVEEGDKKIAPVVEFAWGTYRFRGIFTSYKETLDYFSATGVPLRASISLSMTQQDGLFDPTAKGEAPLDDSEAFEPVGEEDPDGRGPVTGDPETDRGLAEDNGEENPRFFSGKSLSLPSGPDLQLPAAFASGGLSIGASGGIGIGVSGGFGIGVSGGIGIGVSGGIGIGVDVGFSAGVSAGIGIGIGIDAGIDVGLSAGFEVDIGVDVNFEAKVSGSVSVAAGGAFTGSSVGAAASSGSAAGGGSLGADGAVGAGSAVGGSSSGGVGGGAAGGAISAGDLGGAVFGAFGGGEFTRSGPAAAVRSRVRGPGATSASDDAFEELPMGPRFGGLAAAGVPAALGAFDGLRPVSPRRRKPISLAELRGTRPERQLRTDAAASFAIGGRAIDRSPKGLSADVGARASLADRITFDDTLD